MSGVPWYAIASDFSTHPKTLELCERIDDPNAGMYVVRLFEHCATHALDGQVRAAAVEEIARWRGKRGALRVALEAIRVLEGGGETLTFTLHGWEERNGARIRKAMKDNLRPNAKDRNPAKTPRGVSGGKARGPDESQRGIAAGKPLEREIEKYIDPSGLRSAIVEDRNSDPKEGETREPARLPLHVDQASLEDLLLGLTQDYELLRQDSFNAASDRVRVREARAAEEILVAAKGDVEEVRLRWRTALVHTEWPRVNTLRDLQQHWQHFGNPPEHARERLRRLNAGGVA